MDALLDLSIMFTACLAATIAVTGLLRLLGKTSDWFNVIAIPIGVTVAEALRLAWPMSDTEFLPVILGTVAVVVGCAQYVKMRRERHE